MWYSFYYNTGGATNIQIVVCEQLIASIESSQLDGNILSTENTLLAQANSIKLTANIVLC